MFVQSMLKVEAMHWSNVESRVRASKVARNSTWEHFTKSFKAQFYSTTAIKETGRRISEVGAREFDGESLHILIY